MPSRCEICGGTAFVPAEYRAFGQLQGAYAIECVDCEGLVLDAQELPERTYPSVGTAIRSALAAARASVSWVDEPPAAWA
jgi:hypothetical protein